MSRRPEDRGTPRTDAATVRDAPVPADGNGAGIAALVLGLLAVTLAFLIVPALAAVLLGIAAIILGAVGIRNANRLAGLHKGLSITGLVTGVLGLLLGGAVIVGGVALVDRMQEQLQADDVQQQLDDLQRELEERT